MLGRAVTRIARGRRNHISLIGGILDSRMTGLTGSDPDLEAAFVCAACGRLAYDSQMSTAVAFGSAQVLDSSIAISSDRGLARDGGLRVQVRALRGFASMNRRPFVAGNWKMNLDLASARSLVQELCVRLGSQSSVDLAICPTSVYLFPMAKAIAGSPLALGAQNCYYESSGAFTGEISPAMVKETGCKYVILGHSERRHTIGPKDADGQVHGETDEMVALKARAVIAAGLTPIVCVGETLTERDSGKTESVLTRQVHGSLSGIASTAAASIVIAYEPVWAIGTGRNATPDQAQQAHAHIRSILAEKFGEAAAAQIRILYGGSVKPDNAVALMACPDVDGALVGGASLKAADFASIIDAAIATKT